MLYGLTCISEILKEQNKEWRYRTMTRKRFRDLDKTEALKQLSERILHNMKHAKQVVEHCHSLGIAHYRIPQSFPLMTDPELRLEWEMLPDYQDILSAMKDIGDTARKLNIRIGSHPDQFVILCSPRPEVCDKAIIDLNQNSWFFDQMGLPQSYEAPINIHPSCSPKDETPEQVVDRFYKNLMRCDVGVQKRLTVENEDRGYWNARNLYLEFCVYMRSKYGFKMALVWDNLHNQCNRSPIDHTGLITDKPEDVRYWLEQFKSTWPEDIVPLMHWSEGGKNGKRRSHVDYISESVGKPFDNTCMWELEVKAKDKAIVQLLKG
jgi:UV DNA damage endonuclease